MTLIVLRYTDHTVRKRKLFYLCHKAVKFKDVNVHLKRFETSHATRCSIGAPGVRYHMLTLVRQCLACHRNCRVQAYQFTYSLALALSLDELSAEIVPQLLFATRP